MTGQDYDILEGLFNTVSLVVVTVIDYWIENIYFIAIYFNKNWFFQNGYIYIYI